MMAIFIFTSSFPPHRHPPRPHRPRHPTPHRLHLHIESSSTSPRSSPLSLSSPPPLSYLPYLSLHSLPSFHSPSLSLCHRYSSFPS
eukprot:m.258962 g.258962  ORF g.258962 m.258962 type:complete len:86 (-) comp33098_c0_seq1:219-476(-)